jgi:FtsZ-binding cell division protein ZapB
MAKWPKGLSLTYLKKKAPRIPDYTCIQIDNIIEKLEHLQKNDKRLTKTQVTRLRNSLEKLRSSNNKLRQSGIFWYENIKKILLRIKP